MALDLIRAKVLTMIGGHASTLFRDGSDPAESFRRAAHVFVDQLASTEAAAAGQLRPTGGDRRWGRRWRLIVT